MNDINKVAVTITTLIALCTFVKALMEYTKQGKLKRAELLKDYREKFLEGDSFIEITQLLEEEDDKKLRKIKRINRFFYLGFFEEISVLLNSGIFKADVVHYFFGYYAIKTSESRNFWFDIEKNSDYWKEFHRFVEMMNKYEEKFSKNGKFKSLEI